ncbi:unnamed protein product [Hymenolepis diminuta]|uniref:Uncharacterized protein n=1 Tax=Hymenolepis diminuta TaxID=6216 RepID=A0A564Y3U2_HYMDI|nr:unnamed protein product [Hymenolepis diminuta]
MFSSPSVELKALLCDFEDFIHANASIAPVFSAPLSYSIKLSVSVKMPRPAAANDVTNNASEFTHNAKSGKCLESCYSEHEYMLAVRIATRDEKEEFIAPSGN